MITLLKQLPETALDIVISVIAYVAVRVLFIVHLITGITCLQIISKRIEKAPLGNARAAVDSHVEDCTQELDFTAINIDQVAEYSPSDAFGTLGMLHAIVYCLNSAASPLPAESWPLNVCCLSKDRRYLNGFNIGVALYLYLKAENAYGQMQIRLIANKLLNLLCEKFDKLNTINEELEIKNQQLEASYAKGEPNDEK